MPGDSFLLLALKMTMWGRGGKSGPWSQSSKQSGPWSQSSKPAAPPRPATCWAETLGETHRRTQAAVHSAARRDSPPGANRGCAFIKNTWRCKLSDS